MPPKSPSPQGADKQAKTVKPPSPQKVKSPPPKEAKSPPSKTANPPSPKHAKSPPPKVAKSPPQKTANPPSPKDTKSPPPKEAKPPSAKTKDAPSPSPKTGKPPSPKAPESPKGAKAPSPAKSDKTQSPSPHKTHSRVDNLHEDKIVREILALSKGDCSYVALTSQFEHRAGRAPNAKTLTNIHLRLSALEVLKPHLKELTISSGDGRAGIKEISSRKGLGKFLHSYSTDPVAYPLQTLVLTGIHMKLSDLKSDLPKTVTKIVFNHCIVNNVEYQLDGHKRVISNAERFEQESFNVGPIGAGGPAVPGGHHDNHFALTRGIFKVMNKKYDAMTGEWDDYVRWLAHAVNKKSETAQARVFSMAKFWSRMLKEKEITTPISTCEDAWYQLFLNLDRIAVKDIANFIGGTFKRPRPKTAASQESNPKKKAAAGTPSPSTAPPAAELKKKK